MPFTHDMYSIFEVDVEATFNVVLQDECGDKTVTNKFYPPETKTTRVVCRREAQATEYALQRYRYSGAKDVSVKAVRTLSLQGLIVEMIQQM